MKYFILIIGVVFGFVQLAYSQELDTTKVYNLNAAVVKSSRTNREVIPVQVLTGKELVRLSSNSVADAIRFFSGVQIKDYGGIGGLKTVNIRSMGSQHVGVFYDGIELGNVQNGMVDLGRFSLDNMESVSVYNGQKAAIFQSAKDFGSAGTLYLSTRIPRFEPNKKHNLKASFKTGSFDLINPSLLHEFKFNDKLSSSVSVEYMNTSGKYKFRTKRAGGYDTTEVRKNGDVEAIRAEAGLFGKIHNGEWKAKAYFYNSERGYPGAATKQGADLPVNEDRQWDKNFFIQSSLKKHFGKYSFLLNAKYAYDYLHYLSDPEKNASTVIKIDNYYKQHEVYASLANNYSITPFWDVALSTDFQWNKLDADVFDSTNFVYPQRYTGLVAVASALHLDRFKLQGSLLATYVKETTRIPNANAGSKDEYTPTVIASWQPFEKEELHFRAFYKRIFRMPTFNDLYYTEVGNRFLSPEYTTQYNLGVTYSRNVNNWLRRFEIQTDVYYNKVKDKIIAQPSGGKNLQWRMQNYGLVKIKGVDVALQTQWAIANEVLINTRINYTYQKAQDFTDKTDMYYGGQIPYIPEHSGSLIVNGTYKTWELNYSFIYTGERYTERANIPVNYVPSWYTSDLSAAKTFNYKGTTIRLAAEINNLFNQQYEVIQWYPMPGTNVKFTLSITL